MSRGNSGGYGHKITLTVSGEWFISWQYDVRGSGRIRYPRRFRRPTTRDGADRFAKKHGVVMPKETVT